MQHGLLTPGERDWAITHMFRIYDQVIALALIITRAHAGQVLQGREPLHIRFLGRTQQLVEMVQLVRGLVVPPQLVLRARMNISWR